MSDYPIRHCEKHKSRMTLLLNMYVCDLCDPPLRLYADSKPKIDEWGRSPLPTTTPALYGNTQGQAVHRQTPWSPLPHIVSTADLECLISVMHRVSRGQTPLEMSLLYRNEAVNWNVSRGYAESVPYMQLLARAWCFDKSGVFDVVSQKFVCTLAAFNTSLSPPSRRAMNGCAHMISDATAARLYPLGHQPISTDILVFLHP